MVVSTEGKMHEKEQLLKEERCFLSLSAYVFCRVQILVSK